MNTNTKVSTIPVYLDGPESFVIACNLVFTTSNGFTVNAATDPAAQPLIKEHQKTASSKM